MSHKFPGPTAKKPPKPPVVPQQCPYCDHEPVKTASTLRGHVTKAHGLTGRRLPMAQFQNFKFVIELCQILKIRNSYFCLFFK